MPPAPTCPRSECRAGEGLASFLGGSGSGRGLATSVGSQSDPRGDPIRVSVEANPDGFPFAVRWPEGPGSAGPSKKVGSARRPHASSSKTHPPLPWPASRRTPPASAVAAFPNFSPLREKRSSSRRATMARPSDSQKRNLALFCLWITGISRISRAIARSGGPGALRHGRLSFDRIWSRMVVTRPSRGASDASFIGRLRGLRYPDAFLISATRTLPKEEDDDHARRSRRSLPCKSRALPSSRIRTSSSTASR